MCTASISASMGGSIFTDYTMSKHAVLGLVRSASVQLGAYGVRVNSVSPGPVATPLLCELFKVEAEELGKMLESQMGLKVPVAGKLMSVESVADSVVFLASDEAEFVTGHNLVVDGGFKT